MVSRVRILFLLTFPHAHANLVNSRLSQDTVAWAEEFSTRALIAVPLSDGKLNWKKRHECVWKSIESYEIGLDQHWKIDLQSVFESYPTNLKPFFTRALCVSSADIHRFLGDLQVLQDQKCTDEKNVRVLYEHISSYLRDEDTRHSYQVSPLNLDLD